MTLSSRRRQHDRFVERHQRRLKRRRSDLRWVVAMGFIAIMILVGVELGRSYMYMQDVKRFVETIDHMKPEEVKSRVEQFSHGLGDRNPLIRRAAMMAMKMATGWRLGTDPAEWRLFWLEHGPSWHYNSSTSAPPVTATAPWKDLVPSQPTNAPSSY
jgi:hypothetical protein